MRPVTSDEFNTMVGMIYDCAIDPGLWLSTLTHLRDRMDFAYFQVNYMDATYANPENNAGAVMLQTEWPRIWNEVGPKWVPHIPGVERWFAQGIDESISQMQCVDEEGFRQLPIYQEYVKPQGLKDFCHTTFAKREKIHGSVGTAKFEDRDLFTNEERNLLRQLSPHFRRSLSIGGMIDEGRVRTRLFSGILDRLDTGIVIVSDEGKPVYANVKGEALLTAGDHAVVRHGRIVATSLRHDSGLQSSIHRACSQTDSDIGNFGNGLPLPGKDGANAVVYVLPLGKSDRRRALGPGLAALFLSTGGVGTPPPMEVLSALCGLTSREARVALMVADGFSLHNIADRLGVSINTVRTHVANAFHKTGTNSQQALMKRVAGLGLPFSDDAAPARLE